MEQAAVGRYEAYAFDSLDRARQEWPEETLDEDALQPYIENTSHLKYLEHPAYRRYLQMHKVTLGVSGYEQLGVIGEQLANEYMPRYLDAAAWAYAERGIFDQSKTASERVACINQADELWQTALTRETLLQTGPYSVLFDEYDSPHRIALTKAFTPIMKALVVGDVTEEIRKQTLRDVTAIGLDAAREITRAYDGGAKAVGSQFLGFTHEVNVLSALLYLNDPRYVSMPSTARADSGYFHRKQTHDISILNQHWGTIKKVVPLEVKASASRGDRRRYDALIVRGKMHLTPDGVDPRKTIEAFHAVAHGTASTEDRLITDHLSTDLREMLRLYQSGGAVGKLGRHGVTTFYDARRVAENFPGLNV